MYVQSFLLLFYVDEYDKLAEENENFEIVQQNSKKIRGYLGNKIRHLIRKIPEIKFILDKSEYKASNIEKILSGLDIPKDSQK